MTGSQQERPKNVARPPATCPRARFTAPSSGCAAGSWASNVPLRREHASGNPPPWGAMHLSPLQTKLSASRVVDADIASESEPAEKGLAATPRQQLYAAVAAVCFAIAQWAPLAPEAFASLSGGSGLRTEACVSRAEASYAVIWTALEHECPIAWHSRLPMQSSDTRLHRGSVRAAQKGCP